MCSERRTTGHVSREQVLAVLFYPAHADATVLRIVFTFLFSGLSRGRHTRYFDERQEETGEAEVFPKGTTKRDRPVL